jgi:hypothetical protein
VLEKCPQQLPCALIRRHSRCRPFGTQVLHLRPPADDSGGLGSSAAREGEIVKLVRLVAFGTLSGSSGLLLITGVGPRNFRGPAPGIRACIEKLNG